MGKRKKAIKKGKDHAKYLLYIAMLIFIGLASWSTYNMLKRGSSDILANIGVVNPYVQDAVIIVGAIAGAVIVGYIIKEKVTLEKILK